MMGFSGGCGVLLHISFTQFCAGICGSLSGKVGKFDPHSEVILTLFCVAQYSFGAGFAVVCYRVEWADAVIWHF